MRFAFIASLLALAGCASEAARAPDPAPVTLAGEITRADQQTYKELPFTVPAGTHRITIDFTYEKENRTVIDLGVRDTVGQRGWSGGNKSHIEIGESDATPSYQPGRIQPGVWRLVLGIPNIREGQTAHYAATIRFGGERSDDKRMVWAGARPSAPAGWFRGDFHMHTAHSDGSCDVAGTRGACPAIHSFEAAREAGLEFAAITDHNTITQREDIESLQGRFPQTLLIPGAEVTTFFGHANAIGVTNFVDFQLGSPRLPTLARLFEELSAQGAILSVNHPSLPSGEVCMGCGWTAKDTDWSRITAIEAINGSTLRTGGAEGPTAGIRFWENLLKQGYRLTAIGGSDNHDATDRTGAKQPPIGTPTTVVYASELSTRAIIAGVRSGRVFIDVAGLPGARLDMRGEAAGQGVNMGGALALKPGEHARITALTSNIPAGASIETVGYNLDVAATSDPQITDVALTTDAKSGWLRLNIRDAAGKLLLLGNPIYIRAN